VDLVSDQSVGGNKTFTGTATFNNTINGSISGNAATVTNGVVTTGSYSNPTWLTGLDGSKITGTVTNATNAANFTGMFSGDVHGSQLTTKVQGIQNVTVSSTPPLDQQVLKYNGITGQWEPGVDATSAGMGIIPIASGGTSASTAAQALVNLGAPSLTTANTFTAGTQTIDTGAIGNVGLIVEAFSGQTADLTQWKDQTGAVKSGVKANGMLYGDGSNLTNITGTSVAVNSLTAQQTASGGGGIVSHNSDEYVKSVVQSVGTTGATVTVKCTQTTDILLAGGCDSGTATIPVQASLPYTATTPFGWSCTVRASAGFTNVTAYALCYKSNYP
jgi:hypothetical protein